MVRTLLVRGMLAGLGAALLAFVFAKLFGEPQIDKAIAFEEARDAAAGTMGAAGPVSRSTQSSWGLLTALVLYGVAIGGFFGLAFAALYGRVGPRSIRPAALALAGAALTVVILVPFTKYPSNPPAVGNETTIDKRTALYVVMISVSLLAAIAAIRLARDATPRLGRWNAGVLAALAFVVLIALAELLLPAVHETPGGFPADVLYRFRVATLGTHLVMWTTIGLAFGALTERALAGRRAGDRSQLDLARL